MDLFGILRGSQAQSRRPSTSTALSRRASTPATDETLDPTFRLYGFRGEQVEFATDEQHCWCVNHAPAWDGQSEARVLVHAQGRNRFIRQAAAYTARTGKTLAAALYLPNGERQQHSDSEHFGTIVREGDVEALWKFRDGPAYNPATLPAPGEAISHAQAILMAQAAENIAALLGGLMGGSRPGISRPSSAADGDALGLAALLELLGDEPGNPDPRNRYSY